MNPPTSRPAPATGGFAALVVSLIHQQVSVAAGRSIVGKLRRACGGRITPARLLALPTDALRGAGVSRQKQGYVVDLARRAQDGRLNFRFLASAPDDVALQTLVGVKGIGPWTAKMFLIFYLQRPDVVAPEDLGLRVAASDAYGIPLRRAADLLERRRAAWTPYGSLACLTLWAHKDQPSKRTSGTKHRHRGRA